jgi:hypothetical protein
MIKTSVKPECKSTRTIYGLEELDNYPPILPELLRVARARLRECPFCGKETAWLHYGFNVDYDGTGNPVHSFSVSCAGRSHEEIEIKGVGSGCHIGTTIVSNTTDDVNDIQQMIDYVVSWWNKRPE